MITLQPSLFPQKDDFNPDDFQRKCLTPEFRLCMQQGAENAMYGLSYLLKEPLCTRNKSSLLHEKIARSVQEQINTIMADHDIRCHIDSAGNQRDFISYNGYTFIFRKNLKQRNDSILSDKIDNQELDSHVLAIHYDTDPFWTSIVSLNILYIENGVTLHSFPIGTICDKPIFEIAIPTQPEMEKAKPTIKKEKVKRKMESA
ncbi:MAG: hypothetical protein LBV32_05000 [Tannerellaceae bacterium]|jgi:hypothetical protein|nr:hypothetical protein [Tannerellaceae bacterium]